MSRFLITVLGVEAIIEDCHGPGICHDRGESARGLTRAVFGDGAHNVVTLVVTIQFHNRI